MKFVLIVLLCFVSFQKETFQGKWQLTKFDAFTKTLASKSFMNETEEKQRLITETFEFVLANTFYEFRGDSIFFSNAGGGSNVQHKKGRWLAKGDTLYIFESGKFKAHKFWIENLSEEELELNTLINTSTSFQKGSRMIFTKLK